ncbi:MAG: Flp pilus assembly protein CpaB [Pirellulaceae bacterium]
MKSKSLILMFVSLGFGLIAAIGISQVMGSKGNGPGAIKTGPVLVASDFIEISKELTDQLVKIEEWPVSIIPENALTALEHIQNRSTIRAIPKGAPIFKTDTVDKNEQSDINVKADQRVIFIKVGPESTGNGLLKPGDRVDLIGTFSIGNGPTATTVASTFLKNIEVYSVNETVTREGPREATGAKQNSIVGVILNKSQGEKLALVQKVGTLTFLMRGKESRNDAVEEEDPLPSWLDPAKTADAKNLTPPVATTPTTDGNAGNSNSSSAFGSFIESLKPSKQTKPGGTMKVIHGTEKSVFHFNSDGSVIDPEQEESNTSTVPTRKMKDDSDLPPDDSNEKLEADEYPDN